MKDKWRNYALKEGKIKKGYLRKHPDRNARGKTAKASYRYCVQQSRKEQEEKIRKEHEERRESQDCEPFEEGRQRVSSADQRRSETEETVDQRQEEEIKLVYRPPVDREIPECLKPILEDSFVIDLKKLYNKENEEYNEKAEVGIGSTVQSDREESRIKRRSKSRSRRSSSRNEEVREREDAENGTGRQEA